MILLSKQFGILITGYLAKAMHPKNKKTNGNGI